jgi:hypothetical protein
MGETEPRPREVPEVPALSSALRRVWTRCRTNRDLTVYLLGWALQYGFWGILAYFWVPLLLMRLQNASLLDSAWVVSAWVIWCLARISAASAAVRIVRAGRFSAEHVISLCAFATIVPILAFLALEEGASPLVDLGLFYLAVLLSKVFEVAMTGLRMGRLNAHIRDAGLRATFISAGFAAGALTTLAVLVLSMLLIGSVPGDQDQILQLLGINAVIALAGGVVYGFQRPDAAREDRASR